MAINSSAIVYDQSGGQGVARIYVVQAGARYRGISGYDIVKDFITSGRTDGRVRSIDVFPALDGSGTAAILFGSSEFNASPSLEWQFAQVHRMNYQVTLDVYTDLDPRLTNRYLGLLLVNTNRRGRTQTMLSIAGFVNQIAPQLLQQVNSLVQGLSVRVGPRVRWFWSHTGDGWLQPQRAYAKINIGLTYDPSGFTGSWLFGDYQIDLSFWLDLWVAGGALNGAIVKYYTHVSSGALADLVGAYADLSAQLINLQVNTQLLPPVLAGVNAQAAGLGRTPTDVFLLPGNQAPSLTLLGNTIFLGNTFDDATMVLETQP